MLVGQVPFHADSQVGVAMKHVNEDLPDVQRRRPEVSAAAALVVERSTAKNPDERYQKIGEMIDDLETALEVEAARAGSTTGEATSVLDAVPAPDRKLSTRARWSWAAIVGVLLVAGGALLAVQLISDGLLGGGGANKGKGAPIKITSATDYDPEGDGEEVGSKVELAADGDPTGTAWETEHYDSDVFAGTKTGPEPRESGSTSPSTPRPGRKRWPSARRPRAGTHRSSPRRRGRRRTSPAGTNRSARSRKRRAPRTSSSRSRSPRPTSCSGSRGLRKPATSRAATRSRSATSNFSTSTGPDNQHFDRRYHRSGMRLALAAAAFAVLFSTASIAQGAQRYASPAGSGELCSETVPCGLAEAIKGAESGDEVIIRAGTYEVGPTLLPKSSQVFVHGDFAGPMPRIIGTGKGNVPIGVPGLGGRLSYLEITAANETMATAMACNPGGTIERVRAAAESSGKAIGLLFLSKCTATDSVVVARGPDAKAVLAYGFVPPTTTGTLGNLTAVATGPGSIGVEALYTNFEDLGSYLLEVRNSIVSGDSLDILAAKGAGGPGNIIVANSNFDSSAATPPATLTGIANQTAPPRFADFAAGDYREAAGSPTIDAGSTEGIGPLDLAGNSRLLGSAPDIGAYEFVPPPPAAAALTSLSVSPKSFRPRTRGGAVVSRSKPKGGGGTTVHYSLTAAAAVEFVVERKLPGRRVGRRCVKQTAANRGKKKCALYRPLKGGFTIQGAAGQNSFRFSGRVGRRALKPGRYRLAGTVGASVERAGFTITGQNT